MAFEIPSDWNPGSASWPGGSRGLTVDAALRQVATDLAALRTRVESSGVQGKLDSLIAKYNAHIAAAGTHIAADVDNLVTSTAATDPTADILALVNDLYDQYEAHRVLTAGSVHGGVDSTNVVTATYPATNEAEAVALINDLVTQYEAHRVLTAGSVHGGADGTNTMSSAAAIADWDGVIVQANDLKTQYEAHRVLTAGPVHGAADSTNAVTAADSGAQVTALFTELNEIKTDLNAHIAHLGVHPTAGTANGTANASDEATAVALCNGLKATLNTHIASADDHLDADGTTTPVAATASEYEDIIAAVLDVRTQYDAHRILGPALHLKADASNTETILGTGGAVTIGLTQA